MIFPATSTSIYAWDFPVRYVSHNQRVYIHFPMVFLWFSYGFPIKSIQTVALGKSQRPIGLPRMYRRRLTVLQFVGPADAWDEIVPVVPPGGVNRLTTGRTMGKLGCNHGITV